MEKLCTFCSATATHTLWPEKDRMVSRQADFPNARQEYCERCASALASGEPPEVLSRRLNEEYLRSTGTAR